MEKKLIKLKILYIFLIFLSYSINSLSLSWALVKSIGEVVNFSGDVDVLRKGKFPAVKVFTGMKLYPGDVVRTKKNSKAKIKLITQDVIYLGPLTRIDFKEFRKQGKKIKIFLARGKVRNLVRRVRLKKRFEVQTPIAVAGVRGTDFFVWHQNLISGVLVREGRVEVYNPHFPEQRVIVPAGMMTLVRPSTPPVRPAPAPKGIIKFLEREVSLEKKESEKRKKGPGKSSQQRGTPSEKAKSEKPANLKPESYKSSKSKEKAEKRISPRKISTTPAEIIEEPGPVSEKEKGNKISPSPLGELTVEPPLSQSVSEVADEEKTSIAKEIQSETSQPETTQEVNQPETTQEVNQPETTQENTQTETVQPETSQPETTQEVNQLETTQENAQTETTEPENLESGTSSEPSSGTSSGTSQVSISGYQLLPDVLKIFFSDSTNWSYTINGGGAQSGSGNEIDIPLIHFSEGTNALEINYGASQSTTYSITLVNLKGDILGSSNGDLDFSSLFKLDTETYSIFRLTNVNEGEVNLAGVSPSENIFWFLSGNAYPSSFESPYFLALSTDGKIYTLPPSVVSPYFYSFSSTSFGLIFPYSEKDATYFEPFDFSCSFLSYDGNQLVEDGTLSMKGIFAIDQNSYTYITGYYTITPSSTGSAIFSWDYMDNSGFVMGQATNNNLILYLFRIINPSTGEYGAFEIIGDKTFQSNEKIWVAGKDEHIIQSGTFSGFEGGTPQKDSESLSSFTFTGVIENAGSFYHFTGKVASFDTYYLASNNLKAGFFRLKVGGETEIPYFEDNYNLRFFKDDTFFEINYDTNQGISYNGFRLTPYGFSYLNLVNTPFWVDSSSHSWTDIIGGVFQDEPLSWYASISEDYLLDPSYLSSLTANFGSPDDPWATSGASGHSYIFGTGQVPGYTVGGTLPIDYIILLKDFAAMDFSGNEFTYGGGRFTGLISTVIPAPGVQDLFESYGHAWGVFVTPDGAAGIAKGEFNLYGATNLVDSTPYLNFAIEGDLQDAVVFEEGLDPQSTSITSFSLFTNSFSVSSYESNIFDTSASLSYAKKGDEGYGIKLFINNEVWWVWGFGIKGQPVDSFSGNIWYAEVTGDDLDGPWGIYTSGSVADDGSTLNGKAYGYYVYIINANPLVFLMTGEIDGTYQPGISEVALSMGGTAIDAHTFLSMLDAGEGDKLLKLGFPVVEVGRVSFEGSDGNVNVNLNDIRFFATSSGEKPLIWAGQVSGTYSTAPSAGTTLTLNSQDPSVFDGSLNFKFKKFDTSVNQWSAVIGGSGTFIENNGQSYSIQVQGAAAGNIDSSSPSFTGFAGGYVK